jgi:hypothetical protein
LNKPNSMRRNRPHRHSTRPHTGLVVNIPASAFPGSAAQRLLSGLDLQFTGDNPRNSTRRTSVE